jgi:chaperonin GroES
MKRRSRMEEFTAIKPRGNMVLVEQVHDNVTPGGIELPAGALEGPARVRVIATGPGNRTPDGKFLGTGLKPGDLVGHFVKAAPGMRFGNRQFILFNADSILCVFDEEQMPKVEKVVGVALVERN